MAELSADMAISPKHEGRYKRKYFIQKWRMRWFRVRYRIYPKRCRIRQYYNDNEVYVEFRTWCRWSRWKAWDGALLTFTDIDMALRSIRDCPHRYWNVTIRLASPAVNSTGDQRYY